MEWNVQLAVSIWKHIPTCFYGNKVMNDILNINKKTLILQNVLLVAMHTISYQFRTCCGIWKTNLYPVLFCFLVRGGATPTPVSISVVYIPYVCLDISKKHSTHSK